MPFYIPALLVAQCRGLEDFNVLSTTGGGTF